MCDEHGQTEWKYVLQYVFVHDAYGENVFRVFTHLFLLHKNCRVSLHTQYGW